MPSGKRKGGNHLKLEDDASDFTSDVGDMMLSATSMEDERVEGGAKRRKSGSKNGSPKPRGDKIVVDGDEVVVNVLSDAERVAKPKRLKVKKAKQVDGVPEIDGLMKHVDAICGIAHSLGVGDRDRIRGHAFDLLKANMNLVAENERLKGRLEEICSSRNAVAAASNDADAAFVMPRAPIAASNKFSSMPAKPVDTWAVVVKGKKGSTSKEVMQVLEKEVAPTLGVRVHGIKPMRDGGAVIRTPSVSERKKIVANAKFAEMGLEVSVNDRLGPRIVVQAVPTEISADVFMKSLYEMNFDQIMSEEKFNKSVRLITAVWEHQMDKTINVVMEVTNKVMEKLLSECCYITYHRFTVRPQDPVRVCYRCLGFDHNVRDCRVKESVCRQCGLSGHLASKCPNLPRCRNCANKGLPDGHLMLSPVCPVIAAKIALVNSRH